MMSSLYVPGHSLRGEIRPFTSQECDLGECSPYVQIERAPAQVGGHARCQCGAESPHLMRVRERRDWHRDHKSGYAHAEAS